MGSKNICVDPKERASRISGMKKAGGIVKNLGPVSFEHGNLELDGVEALDNRYNAVRTLIRDLGELVIKDAGLLKTIADAFQQTDESVNKKGGSTASSGSSGKKTGSQSSGQKSTGSSPGKNP